jgi:hypothetical protein
LSDKINYSGSVLSTYNIIKCFGARVQENQSFTEVPHGKTTHCGCSCGEDSRRGQQKSEIISLRDSKVLGMSSKSS